MAVNLIDSNDISIKQTGSDIQLNFANIDDIVSTTSTNPIENQAITNYVNTSLSYSSNEKRVGTFLDGKPIYEKTYEISISNDSNISQTHNISNISKIWLNDSKTFIWGNNEGISGNYYYSTNDWARTWVNNNSIRFRSPSSFLNGRTLYVTLNYTKTTD